MEHALCSRTTQIKISILLCGSYYNKFDTSTADMLASRLDRVDTGNPEQSLHYNCGCWHQA
eukprot:2870728-Amphidinium_carterae.2